MKLTKAMILAAGFGTRLKPLTLSTPKALVKVNGVPMLELALKKLIDSGIKEIVINIHHFAEQVEDYIGKKNFGVKINLIHEQEILGTGGGIKNAAAYLEDTEDFLVHNVDILSDIDIVQLYEFHRNEAAFATLSVQDRETSRPLLIDESNYITGRISEGHRVRYRKPHGFDRTIAFCGIHIISKDIFRHFPAENFFDIFNVYFQLMKLDKKIVGCNSGKTQWRDLGKYQEISNNSADS